MSVEDFKNAVRERTKNECAATESDFREILSHAETNDMLLRGQEPAQSGVCPKTVRAYEQLLGGDEELQVRLKVSKKTHARGGQRRFLHPGCAPESGCTKEPEFFAVSPVDERSGKCISFWREGGDKNDPPVFVKVHELINAAGRQPDFLWVVGHLTEQQLPTATCHQGCFIFLSRASVPYFFYAQAHGRVM